MEFFDYINITGLEYFRSGIIGYLDFEFFGYNYFYYYSPYYYTPFIYNYYLCDFIFYLYDWQIFFGDLAGRSFNFYDHCKKVMLGPSRSFHYSNDFWLYINGNRISRIWSFGNRRFGPHFWANKSRFYCSLQEVYIIPKLKFKLENQFQAQIFNFSKSPTDLLNPYVYDSHNIYFDRYTMSYYKYKHRYIGPKSVGLFFKTPVINRDYPYTIKSDLVRFINRWKFWKKYRYPHGSASFMKPYIGRHFMYRIRAFDKSRMLYRSPFIIESFLNSNVSHNLKNLNYLLPFSYDINMKSYVNIYIPVWIDLFVKERILVLLDYFNIKIYVLCFLEFFSNLFLESENIYLFWDSASFYIKTQFCKNNILIYYFVIVLLLILILLILILYFYLLVKILLSCFYLIFYLSFVIYNLVLKFINVLITIGKFIRVLFYFYFGLSKDFKEVFERNKSASLEKFIIFFEDFNNFWKDLFFLNLGGASVKSKGHKTFVTGIAIKNVRLEKFRSENKYLFEKGMAELTYANNFLSYKIAVGLRRISLKFLFMLFYFFIKLFNLVIFYISSAFILFLMYTGFYFWILIFFVIPLYYIRRLLQINLYFIYLVWFFTIYLHNKYLSVYFLGWNFAFIRAASYPFVKTPYYSFKSTFSGSRPFPLKPSIAPYLRFFKPLFYIKSSGKFILLCFYHFLLKLYSGSSTSFIKFLKNKIRPLLKNHVILFFKLLNFIIKLFYSIFIFFKSRPYSFYKNLFYFILFIFIFLFKHIIICFVLLFFVLLLLDRLLLLFLKNSFYFVKFYFISIGFIIDLIYSLLLLFCRLLFFILFFIIWRLHLIIAIFLIYSFDFSLTTLFYHSIEAYFDIYDSFSSVIINILNEIKSFTPGPAVYHELIWRKFFFITSADDLIIKKRYNSFVCNNLLYNFYVNIYVNHPPQFIQGFVYPPDGIFNKYFAHQDFLHAERIEKFPFFVNIIFLYLRVYSFILSIFLDPVSYHRLWTNSFIIPSIYYYEFHRSFFESLFLENLGVISHGNFLEKIWFSGPYNILFGLPFFIRLWFNSYIAYGFVNSYIIHIVPTFFNYLEHHIYLYKSLHGLYNISCILIEYIKYSMFRIIENSVSIFEHVKYYFLTFISLLRNDIYYKVDVRNALESKWITWEFTPEPYQQLHLNVLRIHVFVQCIRDYISNYLYACSRIPFFEHLVPRYEVDRHAYFNWKFYLRWLVLWGSFRHDYNSLFNMLLGNPHISLVQYFDLRERTFDWYCFSQLVPGIDRQLFFVYFLMFGVTFCLLQISFNLFFNNPLWYHLVYLWKELHSRDYKEFEWAFSPEIDTALNSASGDIDEEDISLEERLLLFKDVDQKTQRKINLYYLEANIFYDNLRDIVSTYSSSFNQSNLSLNDNYSDFLDKQTLASKGFSKIKRYSDFNSFYKILPSTNLRIFFDHYFLFYLYGNSSENDLSTFNYSRFIFDDRYNNIINLFLDYPDKLILFLNYGAKRSLLIDSILTQYANLILIPDLYNNDLYKNSPEDLEWIDSFLSYLDYLDSTFLFNRGGSSLWHKDTAVSYSFRYEKAPVLGQEYYYTESSIIDFSELGFAFFCSTGVLIHAFFVFNGWGLASLRYEHHDLDFIAHQYLLPNVFANILNSDLYENFIFINRLSYLYIKPTSNVINSGSPNNLSEVVSFLSSYDSYLLHLDPLGEYNRVMANNYGPFLGTFKISTSLPENWHFFRINSVGKFKHSGFEYLYNRETREIGVFSDGASNPNRVVAYYRGRDCINYTFKKKVNKYFNFGKYFRLYTNKWRIYFPLVKDPYFTVSNIKISPKVWYCCQSDSFKNTTYKFLAFNDYYNHFFRYYLMDRCYYAIFTKDSIFSYYWNIIFLFKLFISIIIYRFFFRNEFISFISKISSMSFNSRIKYRTYNINFNHFVKINQIHSVVKLKWKEYFGNN